MRPRVTSIAVVAAAIVSFFWAPASANDIRSPEAILAAVDNLIKDDVNAWCKGKGVTYPPDVVVLRVFKREREIEIWGKNDGRERMQLIRTIPICAMDFAPGPKLIQGDGKTPEGFYFPGFSYGSKYYWMWMNLDPEHVDEQGEPGVGSSFKMCTEYPNAADKARTRAAGLGGAGSEICVHGNCVSAGCPSFKNRDFLPVFAFSRHHDERKYGPLQLHIFPFRFDREADLKKMAAGYSHLKELGEERLVRFWENLREGFDLFNRNPNPLKVKTGERKTKVGETVVRETVYLFD